MIDINLIREQSELVKTAVKNRGKDIGLVDLVLEVDIKRKKVLQDVENLRAQRNKIGKDQIEEGKKIKEQLKTLEPQLAELDEEIKTTLANIPNIPAPDVPLGKDDSENIEYSKHGEQPKFNFTVKDHLDLGESLGIIDMERGGKISGARFGYFKGDGALLEMSLMFYTFKKLTGKGFIGNIPPVITQKDIEWAMGYSEHGGWDQMYELEKDNQILISSSEHSVIPMHKDEVFEEKDLPLRYVNYSTCFRREAGTYGKDTRGMFRVHQFDKVEMNVYVESNMETSDQECLHLLSLQEEIVQDLGLPYQVMNCCTGDLPLPNRRMYDLQCWFPGQNKYRETHSCSNCTDFQTRRLNIRVKTKDGVKFVHALNATAITPRVLLAILENFQQADGSVTIPEVLRPYMGKDKISPKS